MKTRTLAIAAGIAVLLLVGCSAKEEPPVAASTMKTTAAVIKPKPGDCRNVPSSIIVEFGNPQASIQITASMVQAASALDRDGGAYYAASLSDGAKPVWFQKESGVTYAVGTVSALYSIFPDSVQHTPSRSGVYPTSGCGQGGSRIGAPGVEPVQS